MRTPNVNPPTGFTDYLPVIQPLPVRLSCFVLLCSAVRAVADTAGEEVVGQVTDTGDGWYAAAYRLTRAGKFTITLELAGAQVRSIGIDLQPVCAMPCVYATSDTQGL